MDLATRIAQNFGEIGMDFISLMIFLFALRPREEVTAVAVVQGRQEMERITEICAMCNNHPEITTLLIEGHGPEYPDDFHLTSETLVDYGLELRTDLAIVFQGKTANAKTQANWLAEQVEELDITSLYLVAPPYHLPRAYLTTLSSFITKGLNKSVRMYPWPTSASPLEIIQQDNDNPIGLLPGEIDRIPRYQAGGDVASYQQFMEYLKECIYVP